MTIPTPVKALCVHNAVQTQTTEVKKELFECNDDDYISYSPLSERPDVNEEHRIQKNNKDMLFQSTALQEDENEVDDDSLNLFSDEDDDDDDDLFFDTVDQYETGKNSLDTCEKLQTSLAPDSPALVNSLAAPYEEVNSTFLNQELSTTQTALSITQKTLPMAPRRTQTKTGPSGLKQTDIGVFFGLKPLSEKKAEEEVKATVREADQQGPRKARISETRGDDARRQGRRRRKTKAPSEVSSVSPAAEDGTTRPTQTEGKRGGRAEGRKRWNRGRATDGDPEEPKRCPFYKKIPGL